MLGAVGLVPSHVLPKPSLPDATVIARRERIRRSCPDEHVPSHDWVTYRTVLFMMQRLREAMSTINLAAMVAKAAKCKPMKLTTATRQNFPDRKGLAMYSVRLAPRSSRKADIRKPALRAKGRHRLSRFHGSGWISRPGLTSSEQRLQ